jgi:hypothetical protein
MNWKQMEEEVISDVRDILIAAQTVSSNVPDARPAAIIAVVQWQGKQIGAIVFAKIDEDADSLTGMSHLPKVSDWKTVPPGIFRAHSDETTVLENMPLYYYVIADTDDKERRAVCLPKRFTGSRIGCVNNAKQITEIADYLGVAGLLRLEVRR